MNASFLKICTISSQDSFIKAKGLCDLKRLQFFQLQLCASYCLGSTLNNIFMSVASLPLYRSQEISKSAVYVYSSSLGNENGNILSLRVVAK